MSIKVLVIAISTPILVGIYKDNILIETIKSDGKTSDVLPEIFDNILKKYDLSKLLYANGPGSFMSIKVAYIFLKSLSIVQNIPFQSCLAFYFNNNSPIKALGKKYFFKSKDDTIRTNFLEDTHRIEEFKLPQQLNEEIFTSDSLPVYHLPAVY